MTVLYDAGALIAADRDSREIWAEHRDILERGEVPFTTAPVVAQVSRDARQARLRRLLKGCEIAPFTDDHAHTVGVLLARSGTADVVDAHVVLEAATNDLTVLTSDIDDIEWLVEAAGVSITVRAV